MPKITSLMDLVDRILDGLEDGTLDAGFEEPIQRGSATGSVRVVSGTCQRQWDTLRD